MLFGCGFTLFLVLVLFVLPAVIGGMIAGVVGSIIAVTLVLFVGMMATAFTD